MKTGVDGPVTVIKSYTVPADEADYFFVEVYQENARIMSAQPGFLRSRLHRPLADAPEDNCSTTARLGTRTPGSTTPFTPTRTSYLAAHRPAG
jgi:Antibiotic biosynthesis monooxygenase